MEASTKCFVEEGYISDSIPFGWSCVLINSFGPPFLADQGAGWCSSVQETKLEGLIAVVITLIKLNDFTAIIYSLALVEAFGGNSQNVEVSSLPFVDRLSYICNYYDIVVMWCPREYNAWRTVWPLLLVILLLDYSTMTSFVSYVSLSNQVCSGVKKYYPSKNS